MSQTGEEVCSNDKPKPAPLKPDVAHIEKYSTGDDFIASMNNLSPPVTPEEAAKVRRKIDLRLPPFLLVLYMFTWLDRGALGTRELPRPRSIAKKY